MIVKIIVLIIIMAELVGAVNLSISCPKKVQEKTMFECSLNTLNGDGQYDIKIVLNKGKGSILKVWNNDKKRWQSGFYYLKDFIENGDKKGIKLKISTNGEYAIELKLRKGKTVKLFHTGSISVSIKKSNTTKPLNILESNQSNIRKDKKLIVTSETISLNRETSFQSTKQSRVIINKPISKPKYTNIGGKVIVLNGKESGEGYQNYISKNGRTINWLPYGFCIFLIFLIIVLIWEKSPSNASFKN